MAEAPTNGRTNGAALAAPLVPAVEPLDPTPKGPSLLQEYVAGGDYTWYGSLVRALPPFIDDLTADFGDDLYDRMLWDPQVHSCITFLKAAILEDGVHFQPAIDDDQDEQWDLAKEILDEAEQMLEDMTDFVLDSLWDMLSSMPLGNRVAEIKWDYAGAVKDGRKIINVSALKVKPRRATAFVVDAYMNEIGLLGRPAGGTTPFLATTVIDPKDPPLNLIPRSRFAILRHRPKDGDPRGTSILRAAYEPWWRKRQIRPEQLRYLTQFAGPSLWGTVPENAQPQPQLDADGHPIPGAAMLSPVQVLASALQKIRNGTAGAFPFGTVINAVPVSPATGVSPFIQAAAEANMEITKSILTQQLATEESQHQTRAAAGVHEDVLDTIIRQQKLGVCRMLTRDVLRQWVLYNWGEKAKRLVPKASLGMTEERDRSQLMASVASLFSAGYLAPSQLQGTDEMIGLEIRSAEELPPTPAEQQAMDLEKLRLQKTLMPGQPPDDQQPQPGEKPGDNAQPAGEAGGQTGQAPGAPPKGPVPPAAAPHPAQVPPPRRPGQARMAAGEPVGGRDGATGTVSGKPRVLPDGTPLPPNLQPEFTGIDRWTMAELWRRAVPDEYARLLTAPIRAGHPSEKSGTRSTRDGA